MKEHKASSCSAHLAPLKKHNLDPQLEKKLTLTYFIMADEHFSETVSVSSGPQFCLPPTGCHLLAL